MAKHKHRQHQQDEPALPQEEFTEFEEVGHNAPVEHVVINAPVERLPEEIPDSDGVIDAGPVMPEPIPHLEQNGWYGIDTAPKTGERLKVSAEPDGEGEIAYWRKTRGLKNERGFNRWIISGKWTNPLTGLDILFTPHWWKHEK